MNTPNHRIHSLLVLLALLLLPYAIHAQVDTLEYMDHHYLHQWRDDSAAVCTHDGLTCTRFFYNYGNRDNNTPEFMYFSNVCSPAVWQEFRTAREVAAGFTVDSAVTVVGLAVVIDTLPFRNYNHLPWNYEGDTTAAAWKEELTLYGTEGKIIPLNGFTVHYNDPFVRLKRSGDWGYVCNGYDYYTGTYTTGTLLDRYCNMYKYYFETPISLKDSFYVSFTRYTSVYDAEYYSQPNGYIMYALMENEMHDNYLAGQLRYPLNHFAYRSGDTAQWKHIDLPMLMHVFPILEMPDETCATVGDLHITGAYGSLVMVEWDSAENNSYWEVSYGLEGTAPGDGTIVTCTEPSVKLYNLNPEAQYVIHVRPVCHLAYTQRGAWSDGVVFNPLTGEVGIPQMADTESLTLYPNPASGTVRIGLPEGQQGVDVRLYDMAGREVLRCASLTLDVSRLPQGTYTVRVATGSGTYSGRLLKE